MPYDDSEYRRQHDDPVQASDKMGIPILLILACLVAVGIGSALGLA